MKGRVIGAFWFIFAFCVCYFCWDGIYFNFLLLACFVIAMAEICIVVYYENWRMKPLACLPYGTWAIELFILFYAAFSVLLLNRKPAALVVVVSIAADTGAFICGKLFGKHRVYALQRISPKKTWEGYIGGIVVAWAVGFVACKLLNLAFNAGTVIYLILGGVLAEIGDLIGSATKRQLGIKDSGEVFGSYPVIKWLEWPLRGHGGYLDRVDSISLGLMIYALINLAS